MKYKHLNWSEETLRKHCLIQVDNEKECWICKEPTQYIDYCAEARVCSQECMHELNKRISQ